jgi:hypothetical protein
MSDPDPTVAGFFHLLFAWAVYQTMQKLASMKQEESAAQIAAETAASGYPPGV